MGRGDQGASRCSTATPPSASPGERPGSRRQSRPGGRGRGYAAAAGHQRQDGGPANPTSDSSRGTACGLSQPGELPAPYPAHQRGCLRVTNPPNRRVTLHRGVPVEDSTDVVRMGVVRSFSVSVRSVVAVSSASSPTGQPAADGTSPASKVWKPSSTPSTSTPTGPTKRSECPDCCDHQQADPPVDASVPKPANGDRR